MAAFEPTERIRQSFGSETGSTLAARIVGIVLLVFLFALAPQASLSQTSAPYQDAKLSAGERVDDLLARMTLEEKFWQLFMIPVSPDEVFADPSHPDTATAEALARYDHGLFGFQFATRQAGMGAAGQMLRNDPGGAARVAAERINAVQRFFVEHSRLGIPIIPFDEALHGLVRRGATAFPQAIALAATFDTVRVAAVAQAIAREAGSRGIRQILSPVLNIARDPRWGRTEETYGEDPFLTSAMGVAFVGALERAGIVATPKHFVANVGEGGRDSYPIEFSERLLDEVYFPAFRAVVQNAGARSIMAAYNSVDGAPASASPWILREKLKNEWGFNGFVISDAGGTGGANVLHFTAADYAEATRNALEAGLDVIFQTSYDHNTLFREVFEQNMINPSTIDSAVARVLRVKFELGLFENPYVDLVEAERMNGRADHRALALETATASMVLLKNENDVLPLAGEATRLAVIGQDAVQARLGGYSGPGNRVVSILDGIRQRIAGDSTVLYATGVPRHAANMFPVPTEFLRTASGAPGLDASYWDNIHLMGDPVIQRLDRRVDFGWTLYGPDPALSFDWYSVRWSGRLIAPDTGLLRLGVEGNDGYRLWVGDSLAIDRWEKISFGTQVADIQVDEGSEYAIRLEYHETVGSARVKLVWDFGAQDDLDERIDDAVRQAQISDVAVVVAGIEEGEFRDRSSLALPGRQGDLIRAVADTGTPTVVVLIGGSAITMSDWIDAVDAVLLAWYPGEAGGEAVASILLGDASPAGRLPITFPMSEGQLPLFYAHKPTGRGDDYADLTGRPLFPFGYGLSYTTFTYSDLRIEPDVVPGTGNANVTCVITNTGSVTGDDVIQLYIRDELSSVARPVRELKGFRRVRLAPGESRSVSFTLGPEELSMLDRDLNRIVEPGLFRVMIGASSEDIRLRGHLRVESIVE